ncbi:MAG: hypothetical protein ACREL7_15635 [Longimicrobiales bacterium]
MRQRGNERILVLLDLGDSEHRFDFVSSAHTGTILLNTLLDRAGEHVEHGALVHGHEGLLIRLDRVSAQRGRSTRAATSMPALMRDVPGASHCRVRNPPGRQGYDRPS